MGCSEGGPEVLLGWSGGCKFTLRGVNSLVFVDPQDPRTPDLDPYRYARMHGIRGGPRVPGPLLDPNRTPNQGSHRCFCMSARPHIIVYTT